MQLNADHPAARISLDGRTDPTAAVWRGRAAQHYTAAFLQHESGDVPSAYTANEIALAELALAMAKGADR